MFIEIVSVDAEGNLTLPDQLKEQLKGFTQLMVVWDGERILLQHCVSLATIDRTSKPNKINHLFAASELLGQLNDIMPLSEEDIQAEITIARANRTNQPQP